ncbi:MULTISPECIES: AAA family ATPase [Burkholderia]|uniref:AAA family ATPase n=1 Tax=Burkholderia TaxID=32008 RepID=UPI0008415219|nr:MULTISPECIES: AAA family ATPase [unclassified Burkholderia]AOK30143.1 exodeoxyribonuclease V subunit alpha [Burkholderia sp. Bp7605]
MNTVDDRFGWTSGLAERLPEPADFGLALAEGFARRIGGLARRQGAPAVAARWAARAAFAASRATAAGHVCVSLHALAQRYGESLADVREMLAASGMVAFDGIVRGGERPLVVDRDGRLYLARYFEYETRLARALVERARPRHAGDAAVCGAAEACAPSPEALGERLARYFGLQKERGVDWQRVAALVALTGRVTIVSGGPGTGKTTTVVGVIACLLDTQPDLRIALAAPTGKAAQRMQEALLARAGSLPPELAARLPQTSYTLHRLLGGGAGGRFAHHRDNPLPYDLVVVDEASMIDVALAAHLLDALAPSTRIVLLGDKDQLAAVEAGAVFAELSAQPAFSAAAIDRIARALGMEAAEFAGALPEGFGGRAASAPADIASDAGSASSAALTGAAMPANASDSVQGGSAASNGPRPVARRSGTRGAQRMMHAVQRSLFETDDEGAFDGKPNRPGPADLPDRQAEPGGQTESGGDAGLSGDAHGEGMAADSFAWIDSGELAWLDDASFAASDAEMPHAAVPDERSATSLARNANVDAHTGPYAAAGARTGLPQRDHAGSAIAAAARHTGAPVPGGVTARQSVESACVAGRAIAPLTDCVVWLERNYRFGLDSPIGRLSVAIRRGDARQALEALSTDPGAAACLHDDGNGPTLPGATVERIAQGFSGYAASLRDALAAPVPDPGPLFDMLNRFRALCATRTGMRGADEVNALIAAEVRRAVRVPLAIGAQWFAGRPVMVTRNDYALGLFNGDVGIALPDAQGTLRVWFRGADGRTRAVTPAALPPHETAFALTVHKSQGSEFDEAALILPASFNRVLSRELVYTAITRARSRVQVIGSRTVFAQAVATRTARDSGLAARIADALLCAQQPMPQEGAI